MKNILCKLGIHKPYKYGYLKVTRCHANGKKYRRNYVVCMKCGKRLYTFAKEKIPSGVGKDEI